MAGEKALYDSIGSNYAAFRRPDQRIASAIDAALGDAQSVANIGAGTGSYEPTRRKVLAIEPSAVMIRQRAEFAAPCIQGSAEAIPLETSSVDAAMAVLSIHHWKDMERGLREMARIARNRLVLLTWVPPPDSPPFWLTQDYFPEILAFDRTIFPEVGVLTAMLERVTETSCKSGAVRVAPVAIPHDCTDGFLCAYWRRPELYLDAQRRSAISSFSRIDAESGLAKLRDDILSGRRAELNRHILDLNVLDVGYRLVCCEIGGPWS